MLGSEASDLDHPVDHVGGPTATPLIVESGDDRVEAA
jgi:hypothetical protein